eukprot:COSAG01_NODE_17365_length_1157_cov_1.049149_1_plen_228_part_00
MLHAAGHYDVAVAASRRHNAHRAAQPLLIMPGDAAPGDAAPALRISPAKRPAPVAAPVPPPPAAEAGKEAPVRRSPRLTAQQEAQQEQAALAASARDARRTGVESPAVRRADDPVGVQTGAGAVGGAEKATSPLEEEAENNGANNSAGAKMKTLDYQIPDSIAQVLIRGLDSQEAAVKEAAKKRQAMVRVSFTEAAAEAKLRSGDRRGTRGKINLEAGMWVGAKGSL